MEARGSKNSIGFLLRHVAQSEDWFIKRLFTTKPGDTFWRDSSGTKWQINNWDWIKGTPDISKGYTTPTYDYGSDYPGTFPSDKPPNAYMSTFSKPLPVSVGAWFYPDGRPLEAMYTVNQSCIVLSDRDGTNPGDPVDLTTDQYGKDLLRYDDYTLYVNFNVPETNQWEQEAGADETVP